MSYRHAPIISFPSWHFDTISHRLAMEEAIAPLIGMMLRCRHFAASFHCRLPLIFLIFVFTMPPKISLRAAPTLSHLLRKFRRLALTSAFTIAPASRTPAADFYLSPLAALDVSPSSLRHASHSFIRRLRLIAAASFSLLPCFLLLQYTADFAALEATRAPVLTSLTATSFSFHCCRQARRCHSGI
jgi:hypothetical protein